MNTIFSVEIMEEFKMKRPAGYVDLMIAFEARKRTASPFKNNPLNISLPFSFIDFYKKKKVSRDRASRRCACLRSLSLFVRLSTKEPFDLAYHACPCFSPSPARSSLAHRSLAEPNRRKKGT